MTGLSQNSQCGFLGFLRVFWRQGHWLQELMHYCHFLRLVKLFELCEMMQQEGSIIFTGNIPLTMSRLPAALPC